MAVKTTELENNSEKVDLMNPQTEDMGYSIPDFEYEMFLRKYYDPLVDFIIANRGREGIWKVCDEILKFMKKHFPQELQDVLDDVKKDRELAYNIHGSNKDKTLRKLGSIPSRLENLLFRSYMGNWPMPNKEFRRKFFARYPAFAVAKPEKIGGFSQFSTNK